MYDRKNPTETLREFHDKLATSIIVDSIDGEDGTHEQEKDFKFIAYTISLIGLAICYTLEKVPGIIVEAIRDV